MRMTRTEHFKKAVERAEDCKNNPAKSLSKWEKEDHPNLSEKEAF
jgi:hypothetical protein